MSVKPVFKYFRLAMTAVSLFMMSVTIAAAQSNELIGQSGAWEAYRIGSGDNIVCFITSVPTKLEGEYDRNNRGETRVHVTHHGKDSDQRGAVSVVAGYKYEEGRDVVFSIDGKSYSLFSVDTRAWPTKPSADAELVKAMKQGTTLKVTGISSRGSKTVDTYSLKGFTSAMSQIDEVC
jgi:invasion protein IalB